MKKIIIYDDLGRPIESDEFDERDEFMQYEKIARKVLYQYSNLLTETNDYVRKSGDKYEKSKTEFEQEWKYGPVKYALYKRVIKKIDSAERLIETETYDYNNEYSKIYSWTYDVAKYDETWHLPQEKIKSKYPGGTEISERIIDYIRNSKKMLEEQIFFAHNNRETTDRWEYDKNGHCVNHKSYGRLQGIWTYDSKGNLVEHIHNGDKNRYKIFYK